MTKTNGQIAYEAFDKAHATKTGMTWEQIGQDFQRLWEAAAAALVGDNDPPLIVRVLVDEYDRLVMAEQRGLKALDRVRVLEAQREALLNCLVVA